MIFCQKLHLLMGWMMMSSDAGISDDGITSDDQEHEPLDLGVNPEVSTEEILGVSLAPRLPPRVLVFTSLTLLCLLSVCKSGSVDGTFSSISKQWKQLFIFLLDYNSTWLPWNISSSKLKTLGCMAPIHHVCGIIG